MVVKVLILLYQSITKSFSSLPQPVSDRPFTLWVSAPNCGRAAGQGDYCVTSWCFGHNLATRHDGQSGRSHAQSFDHIACVQNDQIGPASRPKTVVFKAHDLGVRIGHHGKNRSI